MRNRVLVSVSRQNLLDWRYLGSLIKARISFRPSQKWTGDSGINWERADFMTLTSRTGTNRDILLMGTEGGREREHVLSTSASVSRNSTTDLEEGQPIPQRVPRWTLWMSAVARNSSTPEHRQIEMDHKFGDIFDNRAAYAPNSFEDPTTGKPIVWSWLMEEDVAVEYCEDKGWTGCITLPSELFLFELDHVVSGFKSSLEDLACTFEVEASKHGGYTVRTLGIRPLQSLESLRLRAPSAHIDKLCKLALPLTELESPEAKSLTSNDIPIPGTRRELIASIDVRSHCSTVGFRILHGSGTLGSTRITFRPHDKEIVVQRPQPRRDSGSGSSSTSCPVDNREERGPHTLFKYANGDIEKLTLRVFRDGQVLEVYANDRWALATMIYTGVDEELEETGDAVVQAFATCADGFETGGNLGPAAAFEDVKVFEMVNGIVGMLG